MCRRTDRDVVVTLCLALAIPGAFANPGGANVAHGQVDFHSPQQGTLNITNSPGAVINWQRFGIDPGEVTRFIQDSAASAVLNRVVGQDPSAILGSLLSNGRVFLINPNGIVFGPDSVVDTAGLIASTLNLSDEDFHNGTYHFEGDASHGDISSRGLIKTGANGEVFLIAPSIENTGIVQTDGGELILAAGHKVTISSLDDAVVSFDIQAPENEVVNLGSLLTGGGAARLLAGSIRHSGDISADTVRVDADGTIEIVAQSDIELTAGSSVRADTPEGGEVRVESLSGTVWASGEISAAGRGIVDEDSPVRGGSVQVLGERVALLDGARVEAPGDIGGEVLIGGDYQGRNAGIHNAKQTYVGEDTVINVDGANGDGGKVIVWADETAQYYGNISARGGDAGGDGGFVEVSGKGQLDFYGDVDVGAEKGRDGQILLDPTDTTIQAAAGPDDAQVGASGFIFGAGGAVNFTIGEAAIEALTGNFAIQTERDLLISPGVTLNLASITAGETAAFQAGRHLTVNGSITTNGGNLLLSAGDTGSAAPDAAAALTIASALTTGGGDVTLRNAQALGSIVHSAGTISTAGGNLTYDGAAAATMSGGSVNGATINRLIGTAIDVTSAATLTNVAVNTDLRVNPGIVVTSNGSTLGIGAGGILRLQGSGARLHLSSNQTVSGPGTIVMEGTGANSITAQFSGQNVTLDPSLAFDLSTPTTVTIGGTFLNLNNGATIETTGGQTVTIQSRTGGSNTGTLRQINGGTLNLTQVQNAAGGVFEVNDGTLNLTGSWSNAAGSLNVNGGTLNLGGTFDVAALSAATFNRAGGGTAGTVNLTGTVTNGGTFVFDATTGTVNLNGGVLSGGTWQKAAGGDLVQTSNSTVTNAILDLDFLIPAGLQLTSNGSTLGIGASGMLRLQGGGARLHLSSNQTVSGPGTIVMEGTGANSITAQFSGQNVTLDPSLAFDLSTPTTVTIGGTFLNLNNGATIETTGGQTVTIQSRTGGSNTGTLRQINGGTLNLTQVQNAAGGVFEVNDGTLNLTGSWSNAAGSLNVNGGTLNLGGTFDVAALSAATFNRAAGGTAGTVNLTGTATNGGTFVFDTTTGTVNLNGGVLSGGTWQKAAGGDLVQTSNSTVTNAILDLDFLIPAGLQLTSNGSTLGIGASGMLRLQGGGARLHLSSNQTVSGPGTIVMEGTGANSITAQFSGQNVTLDPSLAFDLSTPTTVTIGGTFLNLNNGATIETTGGQTVTIQSRTGGSNTGTLRQINGGTLNLTQVQNAAGGVFEVNDGTLNLTGSWSNAAGSLNVNGGTLNLGGTFDVAALSPATFNRAGGAAGTVNLTGTATNGGTFVFDATTGTVNLNGGVLSGGTWQKAAGGDLVQTSNSTVTNAVLDLDFLIPAGLQLSSNGSTLGIGASGMLRLQGGGARLHLSSNQTVSGPGTIVMEGTGTNSITAQFSGQNINLASGLTINGTANAAIGGTFANLTLGADIEVMNSGQTFTVSSNGTITSTGTLTVGSGATLAINNQNLINANLLIVDGTVDLDTTGPVETLFNTGTLRPGASPGLTSIDGNLDLTGGILEIEISGTTRGVDPGYDAIDVTGSVMLGGQLNVLHLMAFTPTLGDQFQIINATGGVTGTFAGTDFEGLTYNIFINPNDVSLTFIGGADLFWDGASDLDGDGINWSDPLNWSTDTLPGAGDVVLIALGGGTSVDFNTTSSIDTLFVTDDLNIQSGTLTTANTTTINGGFNLSGGTLTGPGTLTTSAMTSVTGVTNLTGKSWNNGGVITISSAGRINMISGAQLTNQGTGVINLTGTDANPIGFGGGSGSTFVNAGTLNKNTATTQGLNPGTVNSTGTMNVLLGQLNLPSTGTHTGTFDVSAGATLNFNASTHTLNAGTDFAGTGDLLVSGSGTVLVNTPVTLAAGDPLLTVSAGTLGGTGALTIDNALTLTGGTLTGTGQLSTTGPTDVMAIANLTGKPWNNSGNVTVSGTGRINMISGAQLTNQGTGVIDLTGTDANPIAFGGGSGSTFINAGTLNKNTAATQGLNPGTVNNTGTMNVLLGQLRLPSSGTHTGTFDLSAGTTLNFNASTHTLNAGTDFIGTGDLLVSGSGTVLVNTPVTLAAGDPLLTLSAGTLGGTAALTIDNTLTLTGGTLTGTGLLTTTGATNVTAIVNLTGKPWSNSGNLAVGAAGRINMISGAQLTNQVTGIINLTGTDANPIGYGGGSGSTFDNAGTLNKNTATTQGINTGTVNNTGTMNVLLGQLNLPSNGTHTGTFDVSAGATLNFNASTHALSAGIDFTGTGDLLVSGSGTVLVNTPVTLAVGDPLLTVSGGTLGGTATLTLDDTFTLTGGTLTGTGGLSTTGATNVTAIVNLTAKPWDNSGTLTVSGAGRINMISGAQLTNQATGIIHLTGSDVTPIGYGGGSGSTFDNAGTLNKNTATTQGINTGTVNNTGTMNVLLGQMNLPSNGTHTGTFDVSGGTTLNFNASTHTLNAGTDFTGNGDLLVSGSTAVNVETPLTLNVGDPTLIVSGGTLGGAAQLTVNNTLSLTGGTLTGNGLLQTTGATNITGAARTSGKTWDNSGTITISGTGRLDLASSSTLTNLLAGTIDITSTNANGIIYGGGAGSTFSNAGIVNKSAAVSQNINAGTATINTGTINITAGTAVMSDFTVNSGTVNLTNGATLSFPTGAFNNAAAATFNGDGIVNMGGGTFTNDGALAVGAAPGALMVSGNLVLTGTSTVAATVGGTNQGVNYDWIDVTGSATLAGTLNATLFGGFTPTMGDQFTIVSAAGGVSGTFSPANLPTDLAITYNPANVALDFMAAFICAADICWDGGGADTLWTNALNWTGDAVPLAGDDVSIDLGGAFSVDFGTTITLNTLTLGADDSLNINSGILTLTSASVFNGVLNLAGGTWTGNGNDVLNGAFNWSGGSATGAGLLTTNAAVTINAPGGVSLARDWTAAAPVAWNAGDIQVTGSTLTNQSTFAANAAATLTLGAGATFANAGTFDVNSNTLIDQGSFNNSDTVNVLGGDLALNTAYTQAAGSTVLGGGDISTATPLSIDGGTFAGAGTVTGDVSLTAASLVVASSTGVTTIDGDFTMTGASALDIEVGGLSQGAAVGGFDHLAVTGAATVAGTLNVTVTGGFLPANGDQFQFLTATGGVSGVFATENLPANFSVTYGGNDTFLGFFNCLVDVCWDGGGGNTAWSNPLNWHLDALPTSMSAVSIDLPGMTTVDFNTTATIDSLAIASDDILNLLGGTLTLAGSSTVQGTIALGNGSLTVNGLLGVPGTVNVAAGTITANGTVNIPGTLNWSGATTSTITGAGAFNASGTVAITQGGDKVVSGAAPVFSGTTSWDGAGRLLLTGGSTLTNQGAFSINGPGNVDALAGSNAFVNNATLTKTGAATAVIFGSGAPLFFDNAGTVNVNGGILQIPGRNLTGTFNTAAGATVRFLGGTNLLGDTAVLGGSGLYEFMPGAGGSLSFNGTGSGTTLGANATFKLANATVGGSGILKSLGTVNLTNSTFGGTLINDGTTNIDTSNIGGSLFSNGSLNILAGASQVSGLETAINSGVVTVSPGATLTKNTGSFNWNGGTLGGAGNLFLLAGGATFNIAGSGARALDGLNLTVGNLNLPGGSFEVKSGSLTVTGTTAIPAAASFIHSGGMASLLGPVNNAGLVSVNGTVLNLGGGGTHTGRFNASAGGNINFNGGSHTLSNAVSFTGNGSALFNGASLAMSGGAGPGIDVASGMLVSIDSTTVTGMGRWSNSGTLSLTDVTLPGVVANGGALNLSGTNNFTGAALNLNGGTTTLAGGATLMKTGGTLRVGGGSVAGTGTIATSGAAFVASSNQTFSNIALNLESLMITSGTVSLGTGSSLTVAGASNVASGAALSVNGATASAGTLTNAGTVDVRGGATVHAASVATSGAVNVADGTLVCATGYAQTAGSTRVNGNLEVTNGVVDIAGGSFTGNGTVTGDVAIGAANLGAGASPGTLTIDGDLLLNASSHLTAELAGPTQGIEYDLIAVSGNAVLGGIIDVVYVGTYDPAPGTAFDLLTYASATGSFNSVFAPAGASFTASNLGSAYRYLIEQPPEPADPLVPEFGVNPVLGTLRTSTDQPFSDNSALFGPSEPDDGFDETTGNTRTKCL